MASPGLRELQRSFFAFVAGREEAAFGEAGSLARSVVRGGGRLDPTARLGIYRAMCLARLVDVLREDYAPLVSEVGENEFERIARAYVEANPSVMPSIRHVSDRFPEHLQVALAERPHLAERAAVERARLEVFAEADAVPLTLEDLRVRSPEEWGGLALRPIAALRVVTRAWGDDGRARAHVVRVWRQGFEIFQATADAYEAAALDRLRSGSTSLEEIAGSHEGSLPHEDAAREAGGLLLRWLDDGILAGLSE